MAFCKNCGTKLKEGASFCGECGQVVTRPKQSPTSTNQRITSNAQEPNRAKNISQPPMKPMSKKAKILTGIIASIVILLIGGYYFINQMFAPQSVANGFMEAITEKDVQKVKEYITEGQVISSVNDHQVESYIDYLHSDPRVLSDISKQLNQDAALLESADNIPAIGDYEDSAIVHLFQKGKKWFIFDHYVVQVEPMYIDVTSSEDKTDILIGADKVASVSSDKKETIGPLLPGEYEMKAVVNGEYGKVEQVKEIDFSDHHTSEIDVDFSWDDHYIKLYHWDGDESILFVNGKSTNQTVDEIDSLGPIPKDGTVKVSIQIGNQKSKEVAIEEGMDQYEFELDADDSAEEEIEKEDSQTVASNASIEEKDSPVEPSNASNEKEAVVTAIESHYDGISAANYAGAYNYFSSSRKSKVTLDGWQKGLQKTLKDVVKKVDVINVNGNKAKAYIEMTSYDDQGDNTVLVQEWGGNWNLIKENGTWKLDVPELKKLSSRVE